MKHLFRTTWITSWLERIDVRRTLPFTRKTPWYRQTWANVPIVAWCLTAPFALFLIWKAANLVRAQKQSRMEGDI